MTCATRSTLKGACLLPALVCALPASAETLTGALEIERAPGAEGCPDARAVAARVEAIAGAPVLSSASPAVRIDVEIARSGGGFTASIALSGAREGERRIDDPGPTCDVLVEALAVTIVILLDGGADGPAPPEEVVEPSSSKTPRAERTYYLLPAIDEPRPEPVVESARRVSVGVAAVYDFGTLFEATGGLTFLADVHLRWVSFGGSLLMLPRDEETRFGRTIAYDFYAGAARACFAPLSRALGFSLCSGLLAGTRRGRTVSDEETVSASAAEVDATFEVEIGGKVAGQLGVFTSGVVAAPLLRGDIALDLPQEAFVRSPDEPLSYRLAVGTRLWFDF